MDTAYLLMPIAFGAINGIRAGLAPRPMSLVRYGFVTLLFGLAIVAICLLLDRFVAAMPLRKQLLVATFYVGAAFLSYCIMRGVGMLRRPAQMPES